jgi:hypothetical protein
MDLKFPQNGHLDLDIISFKPGVSYISILDGKYNSVHADNQMQGTACESEKNSRRWQPVFCPGTREIGW